MRLANLFTRTRRETPAGLDLPGQQFLARAGYIQALDGGRYALLPLGQRAVQKLSEMFCASLQGLGALEMRFPGEGLTGLSEVVRGHLRSHRQLPALLYRHIGIEDQAGRRGGGLLSARSREVLEVYHFNTSPAPQEALSAELSMAQVGPLYALGLAPQGGLGDFGPGGEAAQDWLYPHPAAEESLLRCEECGYAAVPAAADFGRPNAAPEPPLPLEKIATPNCKSIADLARFLHIPESRTAKAVFLTAFYPLPDQPAREELIFAVVRGDREVNEAAVRRLTGSEHLLPASEQAIRKCGAVPGYASPLGLKGIRVIVDQEIPASPNLVAGANEPGYHLLNVNYARDYIASEVAGIALAQAGAACPECGALLTEQTGYPLVSSRRLSEAFAQTRGLDYLDEAGHPLPLRIETYRLELTRLLGCLAEQHHDGFGLRLPPQAAPFPVHLVILPGKDANVEAAGREVEAALQAAGVETLTDDRPESPGVKFNDADLIGLPLRITVGERSLKQGGVELKRRGDPQGRLVPLDELVSTVSAELSA